VAEGPLHQTRTGETIMWRITAACLLLIGVAAGPAAAGPYLGVEFTKGKDDKVRARTVEPKTLAWQMGFRPGDVVRSIGGRQFSSGPDAKAAVESLLGEGRVTDYEIVVERDVKDKSRPSVRKITGKVTRERPGVYSAKVDKDVPFQER